MPWCWLSCDDGKGCELPNSVGPMPLTWAGLFGSSVAALVAWCSTFVKSGADGEAVSFGTCSVLIVGDLAGVS